MDRRATAMAIKTRKGQPPLAHPVSNQIAAKTNGTRTVAETTRIPRLDQSKDLLAGGKDIVRHSAAETTFTLGILGKGRSKVLLTVVRPKNVLEDKL
jgi:hypothetical protein